MTKEPRQHINYRQLTRDELVKYEQLDRTEQVDHIHYVREGKLVLEAEHWDVPDWSPEEKQRRIRSFQALYEKGATCFGAFDGETLVGISILDHTPVTTGVNRLNLSGLWVSHGYRAQGIGRRLFSLAAHEAQVRCARSMYVSATPSKNTIRFYRAMGCQMADPIDPELFEHEPEDIHLERVLVPVRDLYREDEIQALILLAELSAPVETPNNNHYTSCPKTVEQARTYFRRFALPLDGAYASLAEAGLTQSAEGSWSLTDRGSHVANRVRALRPPIYYFYRDYYAAIEHSAAFAEYAERTFGKDLGQHGFSDLDQLHHMLDLVELKRGARVLDVGCGNGKIAEYISDQTGAHVTGIDYVPEAIEQAQRRTQSKHDRLRFVVGDIQTLRLDDKFDLILSIDSIFFGSDLFSTVYRLSGMLAPRGRLAVFFGGDLAPALKANGLTYVCHDISHRHYDHLRLKHDVASEMRDAFEREGTLFVWENLVTESFDDQTVFDLTHEHMQRYLYVAQRQ